MVCIEKEKKNILHTQIQLNPTVGRVIKTGDILGRYNIFIGDKLLKQAVLVSPQDYKGNLWDILNLRNFLPKTG